MPRLGGTTFVPFFTTAGDLALRVVEEKHATWGASSVRDVSEAWAVRSSESCEKLRRHVEEFIMAKAS